jgi:hypothetical protein
MPFARFESMTSSICSRLSPPSLSWSPWHATRPRGDARHAVRRVARPGGRPRTFRLTSGIQRTHHPAFQNASQTSLGSRLRALVLIPNPEGSITRRSARVRPPEDRFTKVDERHVGTPKSPAAPPRLASLPSPRGARHQTAEKTLSSEELIAVSVVL